MSGCTQAQDWVQQQLDGPVPAEIAEALRLHLAECSECRDYRDEMNAVQEGLSSLPRIPFPDDSLEQVWAETIRRKTASRPVFHRSWWAAAAAAVVLAAAGLWYVDPFEPRYSEDEVAAAQDQLEMVLQRSAGALQRGQDAATRQVLGERVSPAVRRIPILFSVGGGDEERRNRS